MSGEFPSLARLLGIQARYQLRTFIRIPVAVFFTLGLPLVMLVLFNALFGDGVVTVGDRTWPVRQFYTAALAAFTAVSATFTNLANMVPIRRDEGVIKRWRATPLPPYVYVAGFIVSAVLLALVGVVLMLTLGVLAYDLQVEVAKLPAAALTFVVGVTSFAALGMALAALVPSASGAAAAANAIILPLAFVSNVFIPLEDPPRWVDVLGGIFPLRPFVSAFQDCFSPLVDAPAFAWGKLAYVAAWGVLGVVVAVRRFRWEPSASGGRARRSRSRAAPAS